MQLSDFVVILLLFVWLTPCVTNASKQTQHISVDHNSSVVILMVIVRDNQ